MLAALCRECINVPLSGLVCRQFAVAHSVDIHTVCHGSCGACNAGCSPHVALDANLQCDDLRVLLQRLRKGTGMRRQQPAALKPHQPQSRLMLGTGAQLLPRAVLRQQLRPPLRLSTAIRRQTSLRPATSLQRTITTRVVASSSCLHQQVSLGPVMCLMSSEGYVMLPRRRCSRPSAAHAVTCWSQSARMQHRHSFCLCYALHRCLLSLARRPHRECAKKCRATS